MICSYSDLKEIRKKHQGKKIVTCAGCFDLFHVGHLNYLRRGKQQGDILVVVVRDDKTLKKYKGEDRPIIDEDQRVEIVDSIKYVDYTIKMKKIYNYKDFTNEYEFGSSYQEKSLWEGYVPIIDELKPDIVYTLEKNLSYKSMKKKFELSNQKVAYSLPLEGISTSYIITKMKQEKKANCVENSKIKTEIF